MNETISALKTARILISCHHGGGPTRGPDHDLLRSIDILLEEDGLGRLSAHLAANAGRGRLSWMPGMDVDGSERFASAFSASLGSALQGAPADSVRRSVRAAIAAAQTGLRMDRMDRGTSIAFFETLSAQVSGAPQDS